MEHGHHGPITPIRTYVIVAVALMALTGLTVFAAFTDLGPWNNVVALGIAIVKATLIILFFMQVRYSSNLTKVVVIAGWLWLMILLGGVFDDYLTRAWRFPGT